MLDLFSDSSQMKRLYARFNKGIGGIDGCTETSIRWFLLMSTIPLFVVVCLLPAVQSAAGLTEDVSNVPLSKSNAQTPYEYGRQIIKALSFKDNVVAHGTSECRLHKKKTKDSQIYAGKLRHEIQVCLSLL